MTLSAKINLTRESASAKFHLELEFNIPSDGITALFGPSGSGKTSLLRCIAGLEENAIASIRFKNDLWQSHDLLSTYAQETHRFCLSKTKPLLICRADRISNLLKKG